MTRITQGNLAKIFVGICIFMQTVVMLPHHHHEDSDAPCINMFHCLGACSDMIAHECGCGHNHEQPGQQMPGNDTHRHDGSGTECALSHIDMIRAERERIGGPVEMPAPPMIAQEIHICAVHDADLIYCRNTIDQLDRKLLRTEIPLVTSYIAAAIPPRAPSFTV